MQSNAQLAAAQQVMKHARLLEKQLRDAKRMEDRRAALAVPATSRLDEDLARVSADPSSRWTTTVRR